MFLFIGINPSVASENGEIEKSFNRVVPLYINDCYYLDDVTKNERIDAPDFVSLLGYSMISTYESGYELEEGGKGEIEVNFKDNTIILRHTEFSRMSDTIPLFEIDL